MNSCHHQVLSRHLLLEVSPSQCSMPGFGMVSNETRASANRDRKVPFVFRLVLLPADEGSEPYLPGWVNGPPMTEMRTSGLFPQDQADDFAAPPLLESWIGSVGFAMEVMA